MDNIDHVLDCRVMSIQPDQDGYLDVTGNIGNRALLSTLLRLDRIRAHNAESWQKLQELARKVPPLPNTETYVNSHDEILNITADILQTKDRTHTSILVGFMETLSLLYPLLLTRSFQCYPENLAYLQGNIYAIAGLIRHACIPNAVASVRWNGKLVLKASVDIQKGSEITLARYGGEELYLQFEALQHAICSVPWPFAECKCSSCVAPSDILRLTNAVKCTHCPKGYFVAPKELLAESDFTISWKCNVCSGSEFTAIIAVQIFGYQNEFT